MGPLRPLLNFAPGVEMPFFPAGVRTLAVFIFGFSGATGIFIGSLITYFLYFPEMTETTPFGTVTCAAASAFSSYLAMRVVCDLCRIPQSLAGLTLKNVTWIVITQSLVSATLHQIVYRFNTQIPIDETAALDGTMINWVAMTVGDILGAMSVLLTILLAYRANSAYKQHHT